MIQGDTVQVFCSLLAALRLQGSLTFYVGALVTFSWQCLLLLALQARDDPVPGATVSDRPTAAIAEMAIRKLAL